MDYTGIIRECAFLEEKAKAIGEKDLFFHNSRCRKAIIDLLARAEKAEARVNELETTFRIEKCEDGPECVELGKVRKALDAAETRAERAEADFAEARKYICTICVERSCRREDCRWFSWKDKGAK